jgi:DNA-binding response OmpR family regulator
VLSHCRILVVEDEALIGLELAALLEDERAKVVGVVQTVAGAESYLDKPEMNCALLDINLRGETSFAIADALVDSGIPFAFVTGYMDSIIPARHRDKPIIRKPFITAIVIEMVAALVGTQTMTSKEKQD